MISDIFLKYTFTKFVVKSNNVTSDESITSRHFNEGTSESDVGIDNLLDQYVI